MGSTPIITQTDTTLHRSSEKIDRNPIQSFLTTIGKTQSSVARSTLPPSLHDGLAIYRSLANREFIDIVEGKKMPDVNQFWEAHGGRLRILKGLAKKHLISPATSVPSESAFSCAAYIGRKQRSRLSSHNLGLSMFLRDKFQVEADDKTK